ncbi:MAG: aminodeoxychorismate/anthranilate synthase component II [Thermomicrobiales bacterium]|nr:aminodeoxychorismate/anthranilate synthase component II [Thermomicrobiales bacterium]
MILLVDNYDSFTFNLYQFLSELGPEVTVVRNDAIDIDAIEATMDDLQGIVVSPGPCTPAEAGISVPVVEHFAGRVPILGVCLGHQSIGAAFGGTILKAPQLMHGKVSAIHHTNVGVFENLPNPFIATRYHSLIIDRETLPEVLEITAETDDGIIMGLRHRELEVEGVQFHPESILTPVGKDLLANFLSKTAEPNVRRAAPALVGY